jgi:hypothetical protein
MTVVFRPAQSSGGFGRAGSVCEDSHRGNVHFVGPLRELKPHRLGPSDRTRGVRPQKVDVDIEPAEPEGGHHGDAGSRKTHLIGGGLAAFMCVER